MSSRQLATARGCFLGLMLGDAIGATGGTVPATGPLPATSAGQLACFTVEGTIRANVRGTHRGICHPPSVVWHAYARWAALQGIPGIKPWRDTNWPDGWLAEVPALAARRGSAPATVAALQNQRTNSTGAHGLTRTLPIGLLHWWNPNPAVFAAEVAALTHTGDAAGLGAKIVANLAQGQSLEEARLPLPAGQLQLRRSAVLEQLAPDASAMSALAGGIYVATSFAEKHQIRDGLQFAAFSSNGSHVGAVAGALLGTLHGVDALPADWVSRLELGEVADILARDLVTEFVDGPSGTGYGPAPDPQWLDRYPGW